MAARSKKKKKTLKEDQFLVWVPLPLVERPRLKKAAGSLDMPMSEFARRAIEHAVQIVEEGQKPF